MRKLKSPDLKKVTILALVIVVGSSVVAISGCSSSDTDDSSAADSQGSMADMSDMNMSDHAEPPLESGGEDQITASDIRAGNTSFLHREVDQKAADFSLIDQNGLPVSLSSLRGKWVVVDWIYTNCMTVCPAMTGQMILLRDALGPRLGQDVQLVTITFDAQRDDQTAMKSYADRVAGDIDGWSWLTGSESDTDAVAEAYGVAYAPAAPMNGIAMFDHTALVTVIDPEGVERHRYFGIGWGEDLVARMETKFNNSGFNSSSGSELVGVK